jgi:hydrogenase-4 component B
MFSTGSFINSMFIIYVTGIVVSLFFIRKQKAANIITNSLYCMASLAGILASLKHLIYDSGNLTIGSFNTSIDFISFKISMDKLSAFFLLSLSILNLCVSIYSMGYLSHYYKKRNVGVFNIILGIFIISIILVFLSGNMLVFLVSWEVMSLTSYFLVVFEGEKQETQRSGIIYLVMTHIASAFLTLAFILIYKYTGSFDIGLCANAIPPLAKNIIFLCFLVGFGTKAGIIPLHIWLPYAHPSAPSNVSALMSGIMIKTAIFGLMRFVLGCLGAQYEWWGITLLVIGVISTILGVAYALMEEDIKRLLAYCSIENIGIILIGLGLSFYSYSKGYTALCTLAVTASLFQVLNHTIYKGALFFGAGAIQYSTHTKDMEKLGGLIRKMPYTSTFFLIASLSISAIPPFNGFVSEWLTYQSLFSAVGISMPGIKLIIIISVAVLAMAGALAAASFVKCFGISFLARPRSQETENAKEVPSFMLIGMGLLSGLCVLFGVFPIIVLKLLDKVSLSLFNSAVTPDLKGVSSFVLYQVKAGQNTISPALALVAGVVLSATVFLLVKLSGRHSRERKYGTWDCGFSSLNSRMQYSATGFSKPLRIIFRGIYRPTRELHLEEGTSPYYPKSMRYEVSTQSIFEKYLYRPLTGLFNRSAKKIRWAVQTGSIHTYLLYIFISIAALLVYYGLY